MTGSEKLPDTNVILRYLLEDNKLLYEKAKELFEKVRSGDEKVVILESVFVECVYVLLKFYKVPQDDISAKLRGLLHYKGVLNRDKEDLLEALTIFAEKNIDIVDCVLCAKAKNNHIPLVTFDKNLKKCTGKITHRQKKVNCLR